jgi:hypothetical protein
MANIVDEISVYTKQHIVPGVVDGVFKHDPLLAYLKANGIQRHRGSTFKFQENIIYKPLIGGDYAIGTTFDLTKRRTAEGLTFDLKHHAVNVTEFKEHIQIYNKGPEAVYRMIDADMQNAALTMSAVLAIELYNNGQDAGRTTKMNGLAEAINDGSTNSYNGNSYSAYGNVTRANVNSALNAKVTNVNAPITYKTLEETYNDVGLGAIEPNLIVTTRRGLSYTKEKFHPQLRITVQDPKIGFTGLQFNRATIMQSSYAPGAQGVNDADLGNYLASAGETMWFLVTDYMRFWVTDDPEFGFGFSGFKWAQDSTIVAGQYFASCNVTVQAPRLMAHLYAITG